MNAPPENDEDIKPPTPPGQSGMRFGSFGMPAEKPKDFGSASRRLLGRLQRERWRVVAAILMSVTAVCLSVSLPKVLGSATDVVVRGVFTGNGMDFGHLGRILAFACALLAGAWVLQYSMSFILAGVVQRTMYRLRADVEEKLNHLPLSYVDRAQRGDLLSRVTNDID